ncbi:NAD-dependent epimerase/dehydratase family protein [Neobacillus sp. SM06]|uniref:NAD-dependent epimerase/dehydratase family protein n=1 Tax=Neobacillus sp. SM06 TaxID=3422492 RepID=UPI003D2DE026
MAKQKKILITGANGFTGQHACAYFSEKNVQVVGLGRRKAEGSFLQCDLGNDREVMDVIAFVQPDFVLHLAGKNSVAESWTNPAEPIHTNVMGTVHLLEGIRTKAPNARTIVVGSTLQMPSLSSDPLHPYAVSKAMQVLVARTWYQLFGMNILIANPSNLIGPGSSTGVCSIFAEKIVAMENGAIPPVLSIGDGAQVRDFLDVRDAVSAYALLFEKGKPGEQYDLGTGTMRTVKTVAEQFQELAKVKFTLQQKEESTSLQPGGPNSDRLEAIKKLGWSPAYSFRQSARDIIQYFRSKYTSGEV